MLLLAFACCAETADILRNKVRHAAFILLNKIQALVKD
jgi:hypothetical protein